MQIHVWPEHNRFASSSLGLFLGAGVRPLLMPAMKSEPALIGPILSGIFSRNNMIALAPSVVKRKSKAPTPLN